MTEKDNIYRLRIGRLGVMMLPHGLRRPLLARLLLAGLTPLETTVRRIRKERAWMLAETCLTGQRGRLRAVVNESFDAEERRIAIEDTTGEAAQTQRLIKRRGVDPGVLVLQRSLAEGGLIAGRRGSMNSGHWGVDFIVRVPVSLASIAGDGRLRALVNRYKLPGTRWAVEVTS